MSSATSENPSARDTSELRRYLAEHLRTDSDFDAFCIDKFRNVHSQFSDGMDRNAKVNLLFLKRDPIDIECALQSWVGHELLPAIPRSPAAGVRTAPATMPLNTIPPANRLFMERGELQAKITEALQNQGAAVLTGLGGTGKTQLALAVAHSLARQGCQLVAWIDAAPPASIELQLLGLAGRLRLPEAKLDDPDGSLDALRQYLSATDNALLVLDGVTNVESLHSLIRQGTHSRILVTTRRLDVATLGLPRLNIPPLTEEEGIVFLLRRSGDHEIAAAERTAALDLVRELGGLPLALEQAALDLQGDSLLFSTYLERYRQDGIKQLHRTVPALGRAHRAQTVRSIWETELAALQNQPASYHVLIVCALWPMGPLQVEILKEFAGQLSPMIDAWLSCVGERAMERLLEPLLSTSLMHRNTKPDALHSHPLVQAAVKDSLRPADRELFTIRVACVLTRVLGNVSTVPWSCVESSWPALRELCKEVLVIDREDPRVLWNSGANESHRLCDVARALLQHQAYAPDDHLELIDARRAVHFRRSSPAARLEVARHWHYEAQVYYAQGEYLQASDRASWAQRTLQELVERAGTTPLDKDLSEQLHFNRQIQAMSLSERGHWNEAVKLLAELPEGMDAQLAATPWKKSLLIRELDQLCDTLFNQELFLEADRHAARLLALDVRGGLVNQEEGEEYRRALQGLADGYSSQRRTGQSAQVLLRLLQSADPRCPMNEFIRASGALDSLYRTQRCPQRSEYAQVSLWFQEYLAGTLAEPGSHRASDLATLARFCEEDLQVSKLLALARNAEARFQEGPGSNFRLDFAARLWEEDWGAAERLLEEHLANQEEYLRPGHPVLAKVHGRIAQLLADTACAQKERSGELNQSLWDRAVKKYELCLDFLGQTYAPAHPEILGMLRARAGHETKLGLYDDAGRTLLKAQRQCESDSRWFPGLADVHADWADVALEAGQLSQAEERAGRALTLSVQHVGEAHPHSIDGEELLAEIWRRQDRLDAAYEGQMKALTKREAVWGPDHPLLSDSLEQLAELCEQRGNLTEAQTHHQRRLALNE